MGLSAYAGHDRSLFPNPPGKPLKEIFMKKICILILVLLLLMAGDDPEDRNCALLTLALYLFL
jgi:hypothetical protein